MKRLSALLLLVACFGLIGAASPPRSFWIGRYKQIEKLFNERDMQTVDQMIAEKFVVVDERGHTHSRADFIKDELQTVGQANFSQNTVQIRYITQRGRDVVVAYDWRYSLAYDDPQNGRY